MDVVYFEYDGVRSEDYGYCIASFDNSGGISGITTDSQRNFNQVSILNGASHPFTCSTYDDHLEMEFSIIKDPCQIQNCCNEVLSVDDMRFLKKWLNRPSSHKFRITDDEYHGIYWEGSCNIEEAIFNGERIGANITLITNRPYGLFDEVTVSGNVSSYTPLSVVTGSDEIGASYPNSIEIKCLDSNNLIFYNNLHPERKFIVNNCTSGETITISNTLQVSSDLEHDTLASDCNYIFPLLYTSFTSDKNDFYSNMPVEAKIKFNPVAKVVIV